MYNDLVAIDSYEIRVCVSCGLRYPLVEGHRFGTRCPVCRGDTRVVLSQRLNTESEAGNEPKVEKRRILAVLLDNIRSGWNVGSILRSADGFGFTQAFLCGITPTADNEAVTKTSLGAENFVRWSYQKDAVKFVKRLKAEDWKVYGLEEDGRARPITRIGNVTDTAQPQILIIGNEVTGVDPELLDLCDQIFYIPMRGAKKSFNVAIAFSLAAYALTVQNVSG